MNYNPSKYLWPASIASIISWSAFAVVIIKVDPYVSKDIALLLFFLTLFFSLTTTLTIIGFLLRKKFYHNEIFHHHLGISLRQAILLTLCAIGCLAFLFLGVLTWW